MNAPHAPARAGWAELSAALETIRETSPFYRSRLRDAGSLDSPDAFAARVPFTTKADLVADQAAHPPFGSRLTEPPARYTRFHRTSATTGQPLLCLDTGESWDWMLDNWAAIYAEAGIGAGACVFFAFSFGPFLGFWTAFEAAARMGCRCIPGGGLSSQARLNLLLEQRADAVCCTPTYAQHLTEVAEREGLDLSASAVRAFIVAGEPGGSLPAVRARMAGAWPRARLVDHYGMTEVGPVAVEPRDGPGHLRCLEDRYWVEVIDPANGGPARDGEQGELVLTPLGRFAAPLVRYRTGDLVRRDARGWLEGGIVSRADDMVVVRGVNVFPAAVEDVVRRCGGAAEFRVRLRQRGALTEVELEVEPASGTEPLALERRLAETLRAAFALRIPVRCVAKGSLPRFEMKARRWVREG